MFLTLSGKSIHYTKSGTGTPVFLLVHGWGGTGRSLSKLASLLKDTYTVYTLDLPGFGSSDRPNPDWGVAEYAGIITSFLREKIKQPVVFFGHSFGGALGVYIASSEPALFSRLILASASYHRTSGPQSRLPLRKLPFLPGWLKLIVRKAAYKLLYPKSDILNYPFLEENYRTIVSHDLTPHLKNIAMPVLILWGENDRDTPVADARLLKDNLPDAHLVIYPGATHNFPLKEPEKVSEDIRKFI